MSALARDLQRWGLGCRGVWREGEAIWAVVGNAGPALWAAFSAAPEAHDGAPDPLDRYTRRALEAVAAAHHALARCAFEPPYPPILRVAAQASAARQSPLGLLVDPEFGLWHAYRGILIWAEGAPAAPPISQVDPATPHPCAGCHRPCLRACPVGAFTDPGFAAERCRAHLRGLGGRACREGGCLARHACPLGSPYAPAQAAHHMRAFYEGA
ncbi:ferredoxin [Myxococcota bacterium]|nr:ferredoxin [Myxococcota bacterium]